MALSVTSHLPENIKVLKKMFSTIDSYTRCIERIRATIEHANIEVDLYDDEQAKEIYNRSCPSDGGSLPEGYNHFMENMKAELNISSLGELLSCTESALADRWLVTGQYNLMREALSNISWEYDRDMNADITERNLQKKQKYVLTWADSDENENKVPYWNSVIIVTTTKCYVRDSLENDEVISCKTEKGELLNPEEALYKPFRSIVRTIDKSGELFNLFRIKTQQRPVLLYFNTVSKAEKDSIKEMLPSIKSKTKESFAKLISDIFALQEMWICNKREGTINNEPSNEQRLRTIKILQSMLPLIDDYGYSKTIEVYENELEQIERMVNEYVKICKDTPSLHLPISGFGDFTFFEYPQRLKDAIDYISELPPALTGLQKYLLSWEKSNSAWLVSTILLYKKRVKEMYDKNTMGIIQNARSILNDDTITEEEIKKNSKERKALEKACMDALPGESIFYELADRCFYSQPICVSGEIIYKDI